MATEYTLMVTGMGVGKNGERPHNEYRVFFWEDKSVLELARGNCCLRLLLY